MMKAGARASLPGRDGQGRLAPGPPCPRGLSLLPLRCILVTVLALLAACASEESAPAPTPAAPAPTPALTPTPSPTVSPAPSPTSEPDGDARTPRGEFGEPELVGAFDAEVVPGASGLATSARDPGTRYLLDDRPGTSEVWVLREDGSLRGAIPVAGLDALDTESLSVAACGPDDDRSCVYVGDVGDNLRAREDVRIYRFPEPDLADGIPAAPVPADVAVLTYPEAPEDVEAMLVDDEGVPHLVSKAPFDADEGVTGTTRLYKAEGFADGELREVAELDLPPPQQPLLSVVVGDVVTGGAVGPDGRVLLRTYDHVLLATPPQADAPLASLADWDFEEVPTPMLPQAEAVTWAADGCGYDLVSEHIGDVWHVPCLTE